MERKYPLLYTLLIGLLMVAFSQPLRASHIMGTDLTYSATGNDNYLLSLTVYRDCNGIEASSSPFLVTPECSGISFVAQPSISGGEDITPVCSNQKSRCADIYSTFAYGVQKLAYTAKVSLSGSCCEWTVSWEQCCRNTSITTGASGQNFYTEIFINKCARKGNSSPVFSSNPPFLQLKDACYSVSPGIIFPYAKKGDRDSLAFYLAEPLTGSGQPISYNTGYSYQEPVRYYGYPNKAWKEINCSGFKFDTTTGVMRFKPTREDITVGGIIVEQWGYDSSSGKYVLLGKVRRDYQITILDDGTNANPVIKDINGISGLQKFYFKPGKKTCITFSSSDKDTADSVRLSWDHGIAAASFTTDKKKYETGSFCWTPDTSDIRPEPYLLTLTAKDKHCSVLGIVQKTFLLYADTVVEADFSIPDTICLEQSLNPQNLTVPFKSKVKYLWDFGDNDTSSKTNPSHTYKSAGAYTLKLTATAAGKTTFKTATVVVRPGLVATIKDTNINGYCAPQSRFAFSADVINANGALSYYWDFGNGDTSTSMADTAVYTDQGPYIVKLVVQDRKSCRVAAMDTIVIPAHQAYFEVQGDNVQCLQGNAFHFSKPYPAARYNWDFGDGNTSLLDTPTHVYTKAGKYKVMLREESVLGCTDSFSRMLEVKDVQADFSVDTSGACEGYSFRLLNNSPKDTSVRYYYVFDGKDTVSATDTVHYQPAAGMHKVGLVAVNRLKCYDTLSRTISVHALPVAGISGADTIYVQDTVTYSSAALVGGAYLWAQPGTATVIDSLTGQSIQLRFDTTGTMFLKLELTSSYGCRNSTEKQIEVIDRPLSVTLPGQDWYITRIYPVPSTGKVYADISSQLGQPMSLVLTDLNGTILLSREVKLPTGRQTYEIDLGVYPAGMYFLQLRSEKGCQYSKLIKY